MILVFARSFEQVCIHFAGPPIHEWKYVESIEDIRGYKNSDILDLGGWQDDPKKVEAWDVVHIERGDNA
jgi:hypothetical protein